MEWKFCETLKQKDRERDQKKRTNNNNNNNINTFTQMHKEINGKIRRKSRTISKKTCNAGNVLEKERERKTE